MRKRDYLVLSFLLGFGYFAIINLILWGISNWVYPIDFSSTLLLGIYGLSYLLGVLWIFKIKKFSGHTEIKHPDHVTDVAHALKWVQNEIHKYNGDPDNIFLMGHSAGGHLVSLLALDPHYILSVGSTLRGIRGVIGLSGVYNFGRLKKGGKLFSWFYLKPLLGSNLSKEILFSASPLTHARKTPFNFFLITASKDMHLPKDADELAERLREKGVLVERLVVKGFHHTTVSVFGSAGDDVTAKVLMWMKEQIRERADGICAFVEQN